MSQKQKTYINYDLLPNDGILEVTCIQMPENQQSELSDLLALNREDRLTTDERKCLDELMQVYRQGMVQKAEATKIAVHRGLISPLH